MTVEIKVLSSGSEGNAVWLSDGETVLLLDAGIRIQEIKEKLNFRLSEVAACLLTHGHGDHTKSADKVLRAGIDTYATEETWEGLGLDGHRKRVLKPMQEVVVGSWAVLPFPTQHIPGSVGFLLASKYGDKGIYITDSMYSRYTFEGLTFLLLETNYSRDILMENVKEGVIDRAYKSRVIKTHMGLETAKEFLRANDLSRVEQIHLVHLSVSNADPVRFKKEVQELTGIPVYVH